ncbi:hypothetical protein HYFRA_00005579 [Hymenoscyphus fraxineus]|uniref:Uncharacterized protein n=1 Tax=Hymenoscyphus fraxineus TaxID=746836 RepID=A0A9N9KQW7_9HELO|nr:hypothetical protein HYFRA_00005579 [Hymenoscyphus fraxineus]
MSIFSKIKQSRQAAKEHKAKTAEKGKENEPVKVPYKHIPKHAAVDALSGAPSSWKHEDRSKIKQQHQRRSQMAMSRPTSTLSTVSYVNSAAGPSSSSAPALPRNSSYSSYNPTWFDRGGDVYYSHSQESAQRRPKKARGHSYNDSGLGASIGPSPLASNMHSEDVSPAESSGNSTTSNSSDNLEIKHTTKIPTPERPNSGSNRVSIRPQAMVYAEKDIFDRLHTSTTRKLGEAPISAAGEIKTPVLSSFAAVQEPKQKKQRWSLMGKRNSAIAS